MIVFNALQTTLSGGIGRYSYELSKSLYNLNEDMKIVIRSEDEMLFDFVDKDDLIVIDGISNGPKRNLFEQFELPKMIAKQYPDAIIHYPDSMAPIFAKNKCIITVHDIAFKALKDVFTFKTKLWKNFATKLSLRKADRIIAISEYTKKEIVKYYGQELSGRIDVVYNGFNDFSNEKINKEKIRKEIIELEEEKYILTVSTISPRKNIDRLIRAYAESEVKSDAKLVIAGGFGWLYEDVVKLVDELKLSDRIIFTGKINDDELKLLYSKASIFVYPSIYEGFGLPPLEAMSYKIPCIVSDVTSMPEVVGNAAVLFDPLNINDLKQKIENLFYDSNLQKKYSNLGAIKVCEFSWDKCADNTSESYSKI